MVKLLLVFASLLALGPVRASAELKPDKIYVAEGKKQKFYVRDGLITGGDRAINEVVVRDIRRANNPGGFERVVIDLEGTRSGEPAAIERPPYYQLAVTPDERRLVFTVWGNPKLGFDSKKVIAAFKKSKAVESLVLYPRVEENLWTFAMELRSGNPVEGFELSDPVRIIVDIRTAGDGKPRKR
ncbi:MAG TPA: hypothetical protein VM598_09730 [Bdellovibrionota bacterium]|nr:hypothetical protein [Bdellovibrionota bacterium]